MFYAFNSPYGLREQRTHSRLRNDIVSQNPALASALSHLTDNDLRQLATALRMREQRIDTLRAQYAAAHKVAQADSPIESKSPQRTTRKSQALTAKQREAANVRRWNNRLEELRVEANKRAATRKESRRVQCN